MVDMVDVVWLFKVVELQLSGRDLRNRDQRSDHLDVSHTYEVPSVQLHDSTTSKSLYIVSY